MLNDQVEFGSLVYSIALSVQRFVTWQNQLYIINLFAAPSTVGSTHTDDPSDRTARGPAAASTAGDKEIPAAVIQDGA